MTVQTLDPEILSGDYTLDVAHSRIGFVARHAMITKVRGSFNQFQGRGYYDAADPPGRGSNSPSPPPASTPATPTATPTCAATTSSTCSGIRRSPSCPPPSTTSMPSIPGSPVT